MDFPDATAGACPDIRRPWSFVSDWVNSSGRTIGNFFPDLSRAPHFNYSNASGDIQF